MQQVACPYGFEVSVPSSHPAASEQQVAYPYGFCLTLRSWRKQSRIVVWIWRFAAWKNLRHVNSKQCCMTVWIWGFTDLSIEALLTETSRMLLWGLKPFVSGEYILPRAASLMTVWIWSLSLSQSWHTFVIATSRMPVWIWSTKVVAEGKPFVETGCTTVWIWRTDWSCL
jgi:hypothetical protein